MGGIEMSDSDKIDEIIGSLGDWRGETLARMRELLLAADPEMIEETKRAKAATPLGVPTFSRHGIVCTLETYKAYVKLTFAKGAALDDPHGLFNSGFGGGTRRAIDIREGESVDATAFTELVRAAVAHNAASVKPSSRKR
jgi:hypothetical protein